MFPTLLKLICILWRAIRAMFDLVLLWGQFNNTLLVYKLWYYSIHMQLDYFMVVILYLQNFIFLFFLLLFSGTVLKENVYFVTNGP